MGDAVWLRIVLETWSRARTRHHPFIPPISGECLLWKLPREPRDEIFLMAYDNSINCRLAAGTLIVSKQYYTEALDASYHRAIFRSTRELERCLLHSDKRLLALIRHVHVDFVLHADGGFCYLPIFCPKLRSLKLGVGFADPYCLSSNGTYSEDDTSTGACFYWYIDFRQGRSLRLLPCMRSLRALQIETSRCPRCAVGHLDC